MSTTLDTMLVRTPNVCGGRLRIDGTRITVDRIATLSKQGLTAEDISETYPHLSLGQIHAALAYYHVNRQEIEAVMAAERDAYYRLAEANIAKLKRS